MYHPQLSPSSSTSSSSAAPQERGFGSRTVLGFLCPALLGIAERFQCKILPVWGMCTSSRNQRPIPAGMKDGVPVYLPFLLVGSVFVAFVVGGACVGICCCKCLKSQDDEQQSGLAPGQTWLLDPNLPPHLSSSAASSATRSSLRSDPQPRNICMALAPSLPIVGLSEEAQFLSSSPTRDQLLHPLQASHRMPPDHITLMAPASFLKRPYGHSTNVCPVSVMQDDQMLYSGVHI
uniref:Uncharacterized protein n=1 Tax=Pavo cristatus TaxID=9049 RepID=A0A8C9FTD3_PAVCR